MDRKVTGWSFYDSPKFAWYCKSCSFYIGITTHFSNGTTDSKDVIKTCGSGDYIINTETGASEGNYISSIDQRTLLAHYIKDVYNF